VSNRAGAALLIGIGSYLHARRLTPLAFAANDARAMESVLLDPDVCGFPEDKVVLLTDESANRTAIVHHLSKWLPEQAQGADLVVIYFAGHGMTQKIGVREEGFFLPYDADPDDIVTHGVALADVHRWIQGIEAEGVMLCLDCCHAGKVLGGTGVSLRSRTRDLGIPPTAFQEIAGKGRFLLASCDEGQKSLEANELQHGLFTYHLVEGVTGAGDSDGDGKVGISELFEYVAMTVEKEARERFQHQQKPWISSTNSGGVYISTPGKRRGGAPSRIPVERLWREQGAAAALREIELRLPGLTEDQLLDLLRFLRQKKDPASVPLLFRLLPHTFPSIREGARKAIQALGWEQVADAVVELSRSNDEPALSGILDGLAAFEAHQDVVLLLRRLRVHLKSPLRERAVQLLEHKQLGLELEKLDGLFRSKQSPYRIQKVLGQGLYTAAYLARAELTGLDVVVRVLRQEFASQPHVPTQFLDLCRRSVRLVHHNLVLTRDMGAFPELDVYYAVRDYVPGLPLREVLQSGKKFEPLQIVKLLRELLEALRPIHGAEIVHCGIKPSNIFVEKDRIILGDLSLPPPSGSMNRDCLAYAYRYVSPELLDGSLSQGSDLYALGCVAYELACGSPPFVSEHPLALATRHARDPIEAPTRCGSQLGPAGDDFIQRLLAKSPTDRFADLEKVQEALAFLQETLQPRNKSSRGGKDVPPATPESEEPQTSAPFFRDASLLKYGNKHSIVPFGRPASGRPDVDSGVVEPGEDVESFHTIPPGDVEQESGVAEPDDDRSNHTDPRATQPPRDSAFGGHPKSPVLPDYEILMELGRGGMGVVYKARDLKLNRLVALKMIRAGGHASEADIKRFLAEAQAVARLDHPHIVPIFEIGTTDGLPYFAMALLEGGSLKQRLADGPVPARVAARLLRQVAEGVQHAHEHGVIHRDLKPHNILLQHDDSRPAPGVISLPGRARTQDALDLAAGEVARGSGLSMPRVSDFGLARLVGQDGMSLTGEVMGTPSYMSPEQAAGRIREIGPAADIYGLGAVLYELLTGRPPFQAPTPMETLRQVQDQEPVPPRRLKTGVPRDLEIICLKCLSKEPAKRYATARELGNDLDRFLRGEPIRARSITRMERAYKWAKRRPWVAFLLILCALLLTTVGILGFVLFQLYSRQSP
jgi:serine/threonine protein kinase